MKNYILGFLSAALLYGLAAQAIDIKLEEITVRDLYFSSCMGSIKGYTTEEQHVEWAWSLANKMIERRKKR